MIWLEFSNVFPLFQPFQDGMMIPNDDCLFEGPKPPLIGCIQRAACSWLVHEKADIFMYPLVICYIAMENGP